MRETLERELKLSPRKGFRLPELPGKRLSARIFTSTYYDTLENRLARGGVTLRRRVEDRKGLWQLKFPKGISRLELELPGGPGEPPDEMQDLLIAFTRGRRLDPVAKLRTKRAGILVRDGDRDIAEVVLDSVAIMNEGRVTRSFRELEVELLDGEEADLQRLDIVLRLAGAEDADGRPKLFQALDLPTPPSEVSPPKTATPHEHLRTMLRRQRDAIIRHDPGTRIGSDPEELHQMRVATRRFRAFLRAGHPLLDVEWAESLREELAWLGSALGPVRDLDVFTEYLHAEAGLLEPDEQRVLGRLFTSLGEERNEARSTLLEALSSERYLALLSRLDAPPWTFPSEVTLNEIAAGEFKGLRTAVKELGPDPPDDELHATRIKGKRARYAAELAEATRGKPATRFISRARDFQDCVGEHQDAVIAEQKIRLFLEDVGGSRTAFAAGRLVEMQRARRRHARAAFPLVWKRFEKTGAKAWA